MITEKVLLCGNTLMKWCCGATLCFLLQEGRSKASNFISCLELFEQPSWDNGSIRLFGYNRFLWLSPLVKSCTYFDFLPKFTEFRNGYSEYYCQSIMLKTVFLRK